MLEGTLKYRLKKGRTKMEFIKARTILSKVKYGNEWYGLDYNMNLYRGCSHGCIYCDSRSNCYKIDNFDQVKGKENALAILEHELIKKREKGVIGIGSMSDPYNPQEIKYEITRGALKLISKYSFGVSIDTKSDLILRDIDLLKEINTKNNVIIKFTITTPHDGLSKVIEPNVALSSRRLEAIKKLSAEGLFVGIMMNPVLPLITDQEEDIKKLIQLAYQNGAKFIHTYMGMTLRDYQREYYYQKLDQHFEGYTQKYRKIYKEKYMCTSLKAKKLYQIFASECEKYGILYKMEDIIQAYKKKAKSPIQISLFD